MQIKANDLSVSWWRHFQVYKCLADKLSNKWNMQSHANRSACLNCVWLSTKRRCQLIPLLATICALTTTAQLQSHSCFLLWLVTQGVNQICNATAFHATKIPVWNFRHSRCHRRERYIPVAQTWPRPPCVWFVSNKNATKAKIKQKSPKKKWQTSTHSSYHYKLINLNSWV